MIDRRTMLAVLGGGTAAMLGGCNVVAPIASVIAGPPKRDAELILEPRPTVVLVDDRNNRIPLRSRQVRRRIGKGITDILNTRDDLIPGSLIDSGDAIALADVRDRAGKRVPAGDLATELGAEVIIVVRMNSFVFTTQGIPRPSAGASVRVLDVVQRARLLPPPDALENDRSITAELPAVDPLAYASESAKVALSFELADALAIQIAKLFYRHEIKEVGANLR